MSEIKTVDEIYEEVLEEAQDSYTSGAYVASARIHKLERELNRLEKIIADVAEPDYYREGSDEFNAILGAINKIYPNTYK